MNSLSKPLSKTVQQRQLKRLRPRHYEILARYLTGQSRKDIAAEMDIGEQRLSVIINSPIFQQELQKRWEVREQAVIQRLKERDKRRLDAVTEMMRTGVGDPAILEPPIFDRWKPKRNNHQDDQEGLGEIILKEINRMREDGKKTATPKPPEMEPTPSKPEPKEPEPLLQPTADRVIERKSLAVEPADRRQASTDSSKVQAAKFYSKVLQAWIWLVLDYPGEKTAYYEASPMLRLTKGSQWKIYPRPFAPSDGYVCYLGDEIPQLRGKSLEELRALHQNRKDC